MIPNDGLIFGISDLTWGVIGLLACVWLLAWKFAGRMK
jgi:hypothetical protein